VNELWDRASAWLRSRAPREQWLLGGGLALLLLVVVHVAIAQPLQADVRAAEARIATLETELTRAIRMAGDVRRLRAALEAVEGRIEPGASANLFSLLESLADQAQIKDRLESIKPKQGTSNARYPETRVEVSLKGATLAQTVQFLHQIENAPMHLIVNSIRIKARGGADKLLDVSFAVSAFEKA
jgi:type II secretory pathway component PulM